MTDYNLKINSNLQKLAKANVINDAELWIVFMNARNMTSHTYLESVAEEVYAQATPLYQAVHDLIENIKLKLIS